MCLVKFSKTDALYFQWIFYSLNLDGDYPINLVDTFKEDYHTWQLAVDNIYRLYACKLIEIFYIAGNGVKLLNTDITKFCQELAKDNPFEYKNKEAISFENWYGVDIYLTEKGEELYNRFFPNGEYEILNIEFIKELESIFYDYGLPFSKNPIFKILD